MRHGIQPWAAESAPVPRPCSAIYKLTKRPSTHYSSVFLSVQQMSFSEGKISGTQ